MWGESHVVSEAEKRKCSEPKEVMKNDVAGCGDDDGEGGGWKQREEDGMKRDTKEMGEGPQ
jgi:hypothetical protein